MASEKLFPSKQRETERTLQEHTTATPVGENKWAKDVKVSQYAFEASTSSISSATATVLEITAHGAKAGDIIEMTSGALINRELIVLKVIDADNVEITETLETVPAPADTVRILKPRTPTVAPDGSTPLSLPAGLATEAKQDSQITLLTSLDGKDFATQTTLAALLTELEAKADLTETQPISAASLPLPAGAATEATLASLLAANSGNIVDPNNSSSTPLGISSSFTGTGTDVSSYASISIHIHADQDSALDGMQFQFSTDNTNWDDINEFNLTVAESDTRRFQFPVTAQFFRVVYNNGGTAQASFRLQTILHTTDILTSIHRIDTGLSNDRSVSVTKSVIAGETSAGGGSFVNVKVNPSGSLETNVNQATHDNLNANANMQVGDVDVSGANPVPMSAATLPLPSGASTEATLSALLTELQAKADLTETQPVSAASLPLPTGAATEATLALLEGKDFATQTTLAALLTELQAKADLTETQPVSLASQPLPTGAATEAKQDAIITAIESGLDVLGFVRNDYTSTNVTTGAYVELIASTSTETKKMQIFDSSGQTLVIAIGAVASEVDKLYVFPGGNGDIDVTIPASSRISIKAVSATADAGEISINLLG
jgi:hypothetical protein